jgi:UDP:flavonoid glycosyltransferase YjiC (YdhE family)
MGLFKSHKEIGLISRKITERRASLRMKHGVSESDLLVYLGLGKSLDSAIFGRLSHMDSSGFKILVSSGAELSNKNVIKIPPMETETQNYIAMCDLVVSKAGYSTVSEAIRAKVPMCIFQREGYDEDRLIANGIEAMGIGREISEEQYLDWEWINELDHLEQYRSKFDDLESRFQNDGLAEAIEEIK